MDETKVQALALVFWKVFYYAGTRQEALSFQHL